jgi:hypothetical protein
MSDPENLHYMNPHIMSIKTQREDEDGDGTTYLELCLKLRSHFCFCFPRDQTVGARAAFTEHGSRALIIIMIIIGHPADG